MRASNLSVETSSPSGCDTGQGLFVCVGKDTLKKRYDIPDSLYNILNNKGRQLVNYRPGGEW